MIAKKEWFAAESRRSILLDVPTAEEFKEFRKRIKATKKMIAWLTDYNEDTISRWEMGKNKCPAPVWSLLKLMAAEHPDWFIAPRLKK